MALLFASVVEEKSIDCCRAFAFQSQLFVLSGLEYDSSGSKAACRVDPGHSLLRCTYVVDIPFAIQAQVAVSATAWSVCMYCSPSCLHTVLTNLFHA